MKAIMDGTFAYRLVRSDRLNEVTHKHHIMAPALDAMANALGDAVIRPVDDIQRTLLESVRMRGLERPAQTWVRLSKSLYWKSVFQGKVPPLPSFGVDKSHVGGSKEDPILDFEEFLEYWRNPGFTWSNHEKYFVMAHDVPNPLSCNWVWSDFDQVRYPSAYDIYSRWLRDEVDSGVTDFAAVINMVIRKQPLPDRVVRRLNLYMESDNYVKNTLPNEYNKDSFFIVTRDYNLGSDIRRILTSRAKKEVRVFAVDPAAYLIGRAFEVPDFSRVQVSYIEPGELVEDPGAILHVDYTEFTDGFPHDEEIWDKPLVCRTTRHRGVYKVTIG
jgi:hypothetical protein